MNQKMILLAEDDALLRNALTDKLTREGFRVQVARNGEECVEMAFEFRPDLILLDILMPRMGGKAVLTTLRSDEWGRGVKVILLTNMTDAEEEGGTPPYQSDEYLIKSETRIADVVKKIREHLLISESADAPSERAEFPEYRCACGKLLFKGSLLFSTVEVKCKRCGIVQHIDTADQKPLG